MSVDFVKLIIKLKNASAVRKEFLSIEYSKVRRDILKLLYDEGFIQSFRFEFGKTKAPIRILINLRYSFNKALLASLKLLSKPSFVKYIRLLDIYNIPDRRFVIFFSTDQGLLTLLECKRFKVGGKLLFIC
jgi:small subunit ribosomal protein S8